MYIDMYTHAHMSRCKSVFGLYSCVYMYIYIPICTYMYTEHECTHNLNVHVYICLICIYAYTMHICIYAYDYICIDVYIYMPRSVYIYIHMYIYMYTSICVHEYVYVHTYTCIYVHAYIYSQFTCVPIHPIIHPSIRPSFLPYVHPSLPSWVDPPIYTTHQTLSMDRLTDRCICQSIGQAILSTHPSYCFGLSSKKREAVAFATSLESSSHALQIVSRIP